MTPHVIQEVAYASDLFLRADRALCAELDVLQAAGVVLDAAAVRAVRFAVSRIGFECQMALRTAQDASLGAAV